MIATVIIPIGNYHISLADRAIASAHTQTIPVDVIPVYDVDDHGASWARNRGLEAAHTEFIVFLDADDTLHPAFVEKTLHHWLKLDGARYVYTDWRLPEGRIRYADECFNIFHTGMAHINTTLLPTLAAVAAGGYDEAIRGGEDEDFYARLQTRGLCHARLPEVLVDYNVQYGASATNHHNPEYAATVERLRRRFEQKFSVYRGANMGSCCGGGVTPQGSVPLNEPFEGAVLATALYTPTRMTGPRSGIGYRRAGMGQKLYVHRDDVQARPDLWQVVPNVDDLVPSREDVLREAGLI